MKREKTIHVSEKKGEKMLATLFTLTYCLQAFFNVLNFQWVPILPISYFYLDEFMKYENISE